MNYISAKEFSSKPENVKKALIDLWKISEYDLVERVDYAPDTNTCSHESYRSENKSVGCLRRFKTKCIINNSSYVPLFTEGQLRDFIEEKTNGTVNVEACFDAEDNKFYRVGVMLKANCWTKYEAKSKTLIEAYWNLICDIVSE